MTVQDLKALGSSSPHLWGRVQNYTKFFAQDCRVLHLDPFPEPGVGVPVVYKRTKIYLDYNLVVGLPGRHALAERAGPMSRRLKIEHNKSTLRLNVKPEHIPFPIKERTFRIGELGMGSLFLVLAQIPGAEQAGAAGPTQSNKKSKSTVVLSAHHQAIQNYIKEEVLAEDIFSTPCGGEKASNPIHELNNECAVAFQEIFFRKYHLLHSELGTLGLTTEPTFVIIRYGQNILVSSEEPIQAPILADRDIVTNALAKYFSEEVLPNVRSISVAFASNIEVYYLEDVYGSTTNEKYEVPLGVLLDHGPPAFVRPRLIVRHPIAFSSSFGNISGPTVDVAVQFEVDEINTELNRPLPPVKALASNLYSMTAKTLRPSIQHSLVAKGEMAAAFGHPGGQMSLRVDKLVHNRLTEMREGKIADKIEQGLRQAMDSPHHCGMRYELEFEVDLTALETRSRTWDQITQKILTPLAVIVIDNIEDIAMMFKYFPTEEFPGVFLHVMKPFLDVIQHHAIQRRVSNVSNVGANEVVALCERLLNHAISGHPRTITNIFKNTGLVHSIKHYRFPSINPLILDLASGDIHPTGYPQRLLTDTRAGLTKPNFAYLEAVRYVYGVKAGETALRAAERDLFLAEMFDRSGRTSNAATPAELERRLRYVVFLALDAMFKEIAEFIGKQLRIKLVDLDKADVELATQTYTNGAFDVEMARLTVIRKARLAAIDQWLSGASNVYSFFEERRLVMLYDAFCTNPSLDPLAYISGSVSMVNVKRIVPTELKIGRNLVLPPASQGTFSIGSLAYEIMLLAFPGLESVQSLVDYSITPGRPVGLHKNAKWPTSFAELGEMFGIPCKSGRPLNPLIVSDQTPAHLKQLIEAYIDEHHVNYFPLPITFRGAAANQHPTHCSTRYLRVTEENVRHDGDYVPAAGEIVAVTAVPIQGIVGPSTRDPTAYFGMDINSTTMPSLLAEFKCDFRGYTRDANVQRGGFGTAMWKQQWAKILQAFDWSNDIHKYFAILAVCYTAPERITTWPTVKTSVQPLKDSPYAYNATVSSLTKPDDNMSSRPRGRVIWALIGFLMYRHDPRVRYAPGVATSSEVNALFSLFAERWHVNARMFSQVHDNNTANTQGLLHLFDSTCLRPAFAVPGGVKGTVLVRPMISDPQLISNLRELQDAWNNGDYAELLRPFYHYDSQTMIDAFYN